MKMRLLFLTGTFAFAACGQQTLIENMTITGADASKTTSLLKSAQQVMTRRLAAVDVKGAQASVTPTGTTTATLTLKLPSSTAVNQAKKILEEPFTFDIRIQQPPTGTGGTNDLKTSDWLPTAIDGSMLDWVQVIGDTRTGAIGIELQFNAAGRALLTSIFKENVGKDIGIFVRDLLVSKLNVLKNGNVDSVIISGVPSAKVAEIFADDVNVGLHVTFSPAP